MLKLYCDRCGEQLPLWNTALRIFEGVHTGYPGATQIAFCKDCQKAFENWLWYSEKERGTE